ncbi:MAG: HAMP domain-containing histidine kinase [Phycisphaeraceae bacterium]|nr:HAMP domain-containing histidine kinase [Phycisphaeraceae bacterium]
MKSKPHDSIVEHEVHHPDDLARVEQLLKHFEQLEVQFQQVREGLTHSHRLATLGTIASIIAHEYNNILTPIISYAQLSLAKPDDSLLMKKAVEKALAGAERAAHISASLLGFAREADQKHAARVRQVIDEAIGCLARDPKKDGIALVVDSPDVQVAMSPLNLQQVLLNLFLNAKQAMRRTGGRLTVTACVEANLVRIVVADTGPGIPESIMKRLFEPFVTHRPHADPAERKGTGLGLCICRDLVRNAGGSITVTSKPGEGARFELTIPKADDLFDTT